MTSPKSRVTAAKTRSAIADLVLRMTVFLEDPFDGAAIRDWYLTLARHCPLWALQQNAYAMYSRTDARKLALDHSWRLMARASESPAVRLQRSVPILTAGGTRGREDWRVNPPRFLGSAGVTGEYLVQAYRDMLLRRVGEIPLATALSLEPLRIPALSRDLPRDGQLTNDEIAVLEKVSELRRLVVNRDLLTDDPRAVAEKELDAYLLELGIRAPASGGRPGLHKARSFVKSLAAEAMLWLAAYSRCHDTPPSSAARRALTSWRCKSDPNGWASRLALPFLAADEFNFVRSEQGDPGDERNRHKLTAVYLIHHRIKPFHSLQTTADYALGTRVKERLSDAWKANPLAPQPMIPRKT